MRTLVVSDLHLGGFTGVDVLADPAAREPLIAALAGVERLVLLGDVLELRHGDVAATLGRARPALEAIGSALDPGAEIVLVAGNHDHVMVAPWLEQRSLEGENRLGLEQSTTTDASPVARELAAALGAERIRLVYPGVWLRDDVYATHGHYLDRHITVPTFERLAAGMMTRVLGDTDGGETTPADYEAVLAPLYAWLHVVTRYRGKFGHSGQTTTQNAWRALTDSGPRPLRARAIAAAFPLGVGLVNRLGIGPVEADLSPAELRRAGLRGMAETCRRLSIDADWVLFGHTHRAGPLGHDRSEEWTPGPRLLNTGSWVHEDIYLAGAGPQSPYWPGTVVELDDDGPPRLRNLLGDYRR